MRSVLAATDFSDDARNAALRAGLLAREHGARSGVLLHVQPRFMLGPGLDLRAHVAVERALENLAAELQAESGFAFEPRLASGPVVDEICGAAQGHDLIVAGARGLHPLRDFAIGTAAERLLRKSRVPVLIVKRKPAGPYRRALVPVDFSDHSRAALALAARLAPGAELSLAHAFEVPLEGKLQFAGVADEEIYRYRRQARDEAQAAMEALIAQAAVGDRATRLIEHAYAPTLIPETERRIGADLIAMGKHGKDALEELLLGSVALRALAAAQCDVLVVPAAFSSHCRSGGAASRSLLR